MICGFKGVEDICHHRVKFEDLQGQVEIPGDGTPFIIIGTEVRECHHGPVRKKPYLLLLWVPSSDKKVGCHGAPFFSIFCHSNTFRVTRATPTHHITCPRSSLLSFASCPFYLSFHQ